MERPNHLTNATQSNSSRLTGILIVVAVHVAVIAALIAGLAQGQLLKQIQDIKATVEAEKVEPKAPPPPPPDLAKPPPPVAIVPEFSVAAEAPPPVTTVPKAPPAPPPLVAAAPPAAPTELKPIMRTHTLPPYPTISQRLGEQGTTGLLVNLDTGGNVTECKVAKASGHDRLDNAACDYVKAHWKWQPPTRAGQAVSATTPVDVVWSLKDAQ